MMGKWGGKRPGSGRPPTKRKLPETLDEPEKPEAPKQEPI